MNENRIKNKDGSTYKNIVLLLFLLKFIPKNEDNIYDRRIVVEEIIRENNILHACLFASIFSFIDRL